MPRPAIHKTPARNMAAGAVRSAMPGLNDAQAKTLIDALANMMVDEMKHQQANDPDYGKSVRAIRDAP